MNPVSKRMLLAALNEFGRCDVTVGGESMKPFIRSGDVATIFAVPPYPRIGEIAAFFDNDQLITHRVVRRGKKTDGSWSFTVHGDSSPHSEGIVASSRVIGVVRNLTRSRRRHSLWLSSPLRILAIPVGCIIRYWVGRTAFNGRPGKIDNY